MIFATVQLIKPPLNYRSMTAAHCGTPPHDEADQLLQRCMANRRWQLDPSDEAIGEAIRKLVEVYRLLGRVANEVKVEKQLPASDHGKEAS